MKVVGDLLDSYPMFGLCLVHAHCTLEPGEIMLASGHVSEPVLLTDTVKYYPERWTSAGRAYKFRTEPTEQPPTELVSCFRAAVGELYEVLGLYYAGTGKQIHQLERTEGRRNVLEDFCDANMNVERLETNWKDFGSGNPVTMTCVIFCDTTTTRSGGYHKNTKTHYRQ
ncbi:hypothetical protein GJ744_005577 [Endocarpon pusillum]|uniref:Uncharacterized protein n=1 Tax=Endocarpon pusillum TaxID=364733 RepID=A0A8H7E8T0_9EURO|nr:hypothetical protein GJ744_005577 [Endocarpon pusillum]